MAYVSISKAHKITGVARSTIYKDIDDGKLSATTNARGKKTIMIAELERVYGNIDINQIELSAPKESTSEIVVSAVERPKESRADATGQLSVLQERINSLQNQITRQDSFIDDLKNERQKQRETYTEQIESVQESLKMAQNGYNTITKLLEDKTTKEDNKPDWQQSLKSLESRIANQEKDAKAKAEAESLEKTALEKQLAEQKKMMEEQELALKAAKEAEIKRKEDEFAAAQTWVSKMFSKKNRA